MINKKFRKLKAITGCITAGVMCMTMMTGVNAATNMNVNMDADEFMIESTFNFNGTSRTFDYTNDDYDVTKSYIDKDAKLMYWTQSIVSDLAIWAEDLGISIGADVEMVDNVAVLTDIYAVVTDVCNNGGGNVFYVPDEIDLDGSCVKDVIDDFDEFATTALGTENYSYDDELLEKTELDVKRIVLNENVVFGMDVYEFDYMFIGENVSQIVNPVVSNDYFSSYILEGGIYIKNSNPYLKSVNRDMIVDKNTNELVYHNYPHSYNNENFKNGVLTIDGVSRVGISSLSNTDWHDVDEIVFGEDVNHVSNAFFRNNNMPSTLTFMNKDCIISIDDSVQPYVKTIKGYKDSKAELVADIFGFDFIALDEEVTTTEPAVTTTVTTEETITTTTYASHARPTVECTCIIDENTELCPDCGIPYNCSCGALDMQHPSASTTTVTSVTTSTTTVDTTVSTSAPIVTNDITTVTSGTITDGATTLTTISNDTTGDITNDISGSTVAPIRGDANSDGKLNVRDAAFIATAASRGELATLPAYADHNNDNAVNVRDAASIAGYCAHKHQTDASSTSTAIPEESVTTTTTVSQTEESVNTEVIVTDVVITEPAKIEE